MYGKDGKKISQRARQAIAEILKKDLTGKLESDLNEWVKKGGSPSVYWDDIKPISKVYIGRILEEEETGKSKSQAKESGKTGKRPKTS